MDQPPESRGARASREDLLVQDLLRGVDLATVEPLLRGCPVRVLEPGEVVIAPGSGGGALYLVLEGELGVRLDPADEAPIARLGRGETAGEVSLFDRRPGSATVAAECLTRVLVVDEAVTWRLVESSHAIATNLLHVLARRLRHGNAVISEDRQALREYRVRATVDGLTELFNRNWFDQTLPRQMERSRHSEEPLSLLMLDLDRFKQINDRHGHPTGDAVLREFASRLRENIRPLDQAARYGGEEFALICPGTDGAAALQTAERLRVAVGSRPFEVGPGALAVTVSIGVAQMSPDDSVDTLVRAVDEALYRAKTAGRNRVSG